jgi:hypothetical protein
LDFSREKSMSCDAVASLAFFWLAATSPVTTPAPAGPALSVAQEPLFADIVSRAGALKAEIEAFRGKGELPGAAFGDQIRKLSDLDMQGHLLLAQRGTDGDLKCILRGISQDLPVKLSALTEAPTPKARDLAMREMAYLLNDNVEVITAPPAPPV